MPVARRPRLRVERLEDRAVPATHTWINAAGGNWSVGANWTGGVPTSNEPGGTIVVVPLAVNLTQDIPNLTIDQLQFTAPSSVGLTLTQPLTFNGSLGGNIVSSGGGMIGIDGPGSISFATSAGSITTAVETLIFAPIVGTQDIQKDGASRLTLSNTNSSFTGNLFVNAGTVRALGSAGGVNPTTSSLGNPQAAGRSISVASGATLSFRDSDVFGTAASDPAVQLVVSGTVNNENFVSTTLGPVLLTGGTIAAPSGAGPTAQAWNLRGSVTVGGAVASTLASPGTDSGFHLGPNATFTVADATGNGSPDLVVPGVLLDQAGGAGAAPLMVTGPGTLALNGTNTYTGPTTVFGSLEVNGSITSAVTVNPDGLLGGTGTVTGSVTATALSFVAPGTAAAAGTLRTQNLQLQPLSTYEVRVGGTAAGLFDALNVTGTVDVTGSALRIPAGGPAFTTSQSVVIINNDGNDAVTGTFNGIAQNGTIFALDGRSFRVSYTAGDGNDVALIGATPPNLVGPTATLLPTTMVDITNNSNKYTFQVRYDDDTLVNGATLGADIEVYAPDGSLVGTAATSPTTNAPSLTVTYTLQRSSSWRPTERGNYTLRLLASTVRDENGNAAAGGVLGTFEVCVRDVLPDTLIASVATADGTRGVGESFAFGGPVNTRFTFNNSNSTPSAGVRDTFVEVPVRTAQGDINGDGVIDTAYAFSRDSAIVLRLSSRDLSTGKIDFVNRTFTSFPGYTGGVFVAVGDLNGDGFDEVVVTGDAPDAFSGPQANGLQVRVFDGRSLALNAANNATERIVLADFNGLASLTGAQGEGANVRLGGRVAIGDVNGDGRPDLLVAAGNGGGPRICIWDGPSVANAGGGKPTKNPIANLFVFESAQRGGAFIAAGDVNGDCFVDIILGGGPGGGPRVRVVDGKKLFNKDFVPNLELVNLDDPANLTNGLVLNNFFAFDPSDRGGVRVAALDTDGDTYAEVVAGRGYGPDTAEFNGRIGRVSLTADVKLYRGKDLRLSSDEPANRQEFLAVPPGSNFPALDGVYVG